MSKKLKKANSESDKNYLKLFYLICFGIIVIGVIYFIIVQYLLGNDSNERGTFGDMFGAMNAIFTGFAFAGVIITILMQMEELKLTRRELRKSAEAQNKSQIALNEQLKSMQITTKLDSLKKYLELINKSQDKDEFYMANSIIKSTTEQLFYLEEYIEIVKPKLEYVKKRDELKFENNNGYEFQFIISNKGGGLINLNIQPNEGLNIIDRKEIYSHQDWITFKIISFDTDLEFKLTFNDLYSQHKLGNILKVKIEKKNLDVQLSEPINLKVTK